jgi:hypothetical protein
LLCFVAQAVLKSTPQLLARDRRAVAELGPGDLRMDAAAQAAVGAGYQVFSPTISATAMDGIGDEFRMLDEVGGWQLP